jgi:hypothetical protein
VELFGNCSHAGCTAEFDESHDDLSSIELLESVGEYSLSVVVQLDLPSQIEQHFVI